MSETVKDDQAASPTILARVWREIVELGSTLLVFIPVFFIFTMVAYELRSIPSESMVPNLQVGDRVAVSKFTYGYSTNSVPWGLGRFLPFGDGRIFASEPKRGDVIVFRHPHIDRVMIKRLVGLPGDEIQMLNGVLYIDGKALPTRFIRRTSYQPYRRSYGDGEFYVAEEFEETDPAGNTYLINHHRANGSLDTTGKFVVPEGYLFFMGDNRDNSVNSRDLTGHCPAGSDGVVREAGCPKPAGQEPSVGFVPVSNVIGRAETVLFTLNRCTRYKVGCPKGRVWSSL